MLQSYKIPHSSPDKLGISANAINNFLKDVMNNNIEMHTFMIVRHGKIAVEGSWTPYILDDPHILFSLSKTVSSTAIGLAVDEGLLSVDDLLIDIFPEYVTPEIAANMAELRVRHTLAMATGHVMDTLDRVQPDGDWIKAFFHTPIVYPPGTHFLYNSGASFMLSAIIQKITGHTLLEYVRPRLFDPLGIEYAKWETNPQGMNIGASGLHMNTDAITRLGLLYLQKGLWNDKQIVSEAWIAEASSYHTNNNPNNETPDDWKSGYGYQIWRCRPEGIYRGDGAFGQFCIVLPEQDAVIAFTSGTNRMNKEIELVWEHLLPAFDCKDPNAEDASISLQQTITSLAYTPERIQSVSSEGTRVSGRRYELEPNNRGLQSLSFTFEDPSCTFRIWDGQSEHVIVCGYDDWIIGETHFAENELSRPVTEPWAIAASGTWRDQRTFVMTWRFIRTTFVCTVTCRFDDHKVTLDIARNLTFATFDFPTLKGTSAN